jgi:hypothetical protein
MTIPKSYAASTDFDCEFALEYPIRPASMALAQNCFYTNTPPAPKFCTTVGETQDNH